MTEIEYNKDYRARRKQRMVYIMGGKCSVCGYDKCQQALDLHHLNSETKELTFSNAINVSWDTICKELQKCTLLCANCHREVHAGIISQDQLSCSFNTERCNEMTVEKQQLKTKQIRYCTDCGKIIWYNSIRCSDCAKKNIRLVERPNRDDLKKAIRENSFVALGKQYGVSDNAIRKWCIQYGLPTKKRYIDSLSEEDWTNI